MLNNRSKHAGEIGDEAFSEPWKPQGLSWYIALRGERVGNSRVGWLSQKESKAYSDGTPPSSGVRVGQSRRFCGH